MVVSLALVLAVIVDILVGIFGAAVVRAVVFLAADEVFSAVVVILPQISFMIKFEREFTSRPW